MKNFRITHVFDDDKFIDSAIKLMESVYPGQSDYFVIKNHGTAFNFVKSPLAKAVKLESEQDELAFTQHILKSENKAIFFHALNSKKQKIANRLPSHLVKVWFIWGFDLYTSWKLFHRFLFEKETRQFITKNKFFFYFKQKLQFNKYTFLLFLFSEKKSFFFPKKVFQFIQRLYNTEFYQAAKRIDIVVPVIPAEYELVKSLKINAQFAPFTYGSLEEMLGDKINCSVKTANDILLGNSADPSNNHVDVLKQLSRIGVADKKVFVPLSYGGNPNYIKFVIEEGKRYLGENFMPITDFLNHKQYSELLSNCGFLIFNHLRQQGVGNIIMLGYRGSKIFLNEKSPVFSYYRSLGMHIYSTQKIDEKALFENLTEAQVVENQRIFIENYSNTVVMEKVRTLLKTVEIEIANKEK